jgi:hypothetical protein
MGLNVGGYEVNSSVAKSFGYNDIIKNGLVVYLEAGATESYTGSGTIWYDIIGNYNGSLVNSPTYNSGLDENIQLNGSNQCVELGSFFTYNYFTISLWVKSGSTQTQYADIFDNNHTGNRNFVCQQNSTNTNQYDFAVIGASNFSTTGLFNLTENIWTHLSFTFDNDKVRGYINGSLFGTGGSCNTNWTSQYLRLGQWGGGGRNWNGRYGNFMIYDRHLNSTEILHNYNIQKSRFGL